MAAKACSAVSRATFPLLPIGTIARSEGQARFGCLGSGQRMARFGLAASASTSAAPAPAGTAATTAAASITPIPRLML